LPIRFQKQRQVSISFFPLAFYRSIRWQRQREGERELSSPEKMAMRRWREDAVALSLRGCGFGDGDDDRPEKPRRYGVTEMRSPFYAFRPAHHALQVLGEPPA
jgi:hypothetical protein